jgi:acid phosphatase
MPYAAALGKEFAVATNYQAVTHPSLPNYLAMTGGSTFGVTDDEPPSSHMTDQPSVFGQALSVGKTAKLYAEGMPGNCATESSGQYPVKHNPWAYHLSERASCIRYDVPLTELSGDVAAGRLPNAGMVVPDLCNDAHNCDLSVADRWLRRELGVVMAGPDWHAGHLAIAVTADEDDHHQDNLVLTVMAHPSMHGATVTTPLTHYSLARLYSEVLGAEPLGEAAGAPSMANGLRAGALRPLRAGTSGSGHGCTTSDPRPRGSSRSGDSADDGAAPTLRSTAGLGVERLLGPGAAARRTRSRS